MRYYLDSARAEITDLIKTYRLAGATSNPSILKKENVRLDDFLKRVPEDTRCFVQLGALEAQGMLEEAEQLKGHHPRLILKVPVTDAGLAAIPLLKERGFTVCATAVYDLLQANLALELGADILAVYVNRVFDLGGDGIALLADIQDLIENMGSEAEVLAASFKNLDQIREAIRTGIHGATVPYDLFLKIVRNPSVMAASDVFHEDFLSLRK